MKKAIVLSMLVLALTSCNKVKQGTKEAVNKAGETVGKTSTEFFEGISEGVDKTLQCEISLSQSLKDKGVKTGKFSINSDSGSSKNNMLTLYLIFDKDFKGPVSAKAYDKNGLEVGRSQITADEKAGNAKYFDFKFDPRTYIEVKSKIVIE